MKRTEFNEKYKDYSPEDISKELLYSSIINGKRLETIKGNTTFITWYVIITTIIFTAFILISGINL